ncbi:MAG: flagellar basal body P-ring protein FlgI [Bacteroidetes bacterium]|nr:MAG: flagellar basal body P-ring protein FlgI [Bacteroidota bacterium]
MKFSEKINLGLIHKLSIIFLMVVLGIIDAQAARIKDIATIEGVTGVQVIGYGLVTGLNNTGDNQRSTYTVQSVSNMLKRFGLTIPQTDPRIRNVAAVMITSTIPTFSRAGSKIDVQVSSIGDATSLQGGILLMSPVSTANGTIVGMAQGALSVGGFDIQAMGTRVTRNFVTSARVPNGLILDTAIPGNIVQNQQLRIVLRDPDFTTANNIANAVNGLANLSNSAYAVDAATVQIQLPTTISQQQIVQTISQIELLNIVSDPAARVVINERTGTVVVGGNVQLLPAVIAHGGLEIQIQKQVVFAQPGPFMIYNKQWPMAGVSTITAEEQVNPATPLNITATPPTVQDIANALNLLKVKPRDLISIFQALKESGALQGELIIQ